MTSINEIIPPDALATISSAVKALLQRRAALVARIEELEAEGCIHGNIVEEYRNATVRDKPVSGPYYRLTFYTDPITGIKPKPKYLGKDPAKIQQVQAHIDNYHLRREHQAEIERINQALAYARRQVEMLQNYLEFQSREYKQLVIPAPGPGFTAVTNEE